MSALPSRLRFTALDGLRGLAVLAVMINHVPLGLWNALAPAWLLPFLPIVQSNGKLGVAILFMLTGFLMSWLYRRPTSALHFWAKRYARLFPPFLVMVVSWLLIRYLNATVFTQQFAAVPVQYQLAIVLVTAVVARLLWEVGLKISAVLPMKKWLLIAALVIQFGTAVWYIFGLQRVPAAVFYTVWQPWLQWLATGLINATLTLPFGQYIAQLDGVYWSLVTEVGFYLAYPTLIVPLLDVAGRERRPWIRLLLVVSVLPFFVALKFIAEHVLGMSIFLPYLGIYFVAGVILGRYLQPLHKWLAQLPSIWTGWTASTVLLLLIACHLILLAWWPHSSDFLLIMLMAFPVSLLLLLLTQPKLSERGWLTSKPLLWLGKYSFSLYLTHSMVVSWLIRYIKPNTIQNTYILIFATVAGSAILAWMLYHLIEAPYFRLRRKAVAKNQPAPAVSIPARTGPAAWQPIATFTACVAVVLWFAFRPEAALFTFTNRVGVRWPQAFWEGQATQNLSATAVELNFSSTHANLGTILTALHSEPIEGNTDIDADPWVLQYTLSSTGQTVATKDFFMHEIGSSRAHPFGFPLQADSAGKSYQLVLQMDRNNRSFRAELLRDEGDAVLVSFADRQQLLHSPRLAVAWAVSKLSEPLQNPGFWRAVILVGPLTAFLWVASRREVNV